MTKLSEEISRMISEEVPQAEPIVYFTLNGERVHYKNFDRELSNFVHSLYVQQMMRLPY